MWVIPVIVAACVVYWLWKASKKPSGEATQQQDRSSRIEIQFAEPRQHNRDDAQARWLLPSERISVHGYEISCGLLYVTTSALARDGAWMDPSLIQSGLSVNKTLLVVEEAKLPYWPSYAEVSPSQRARYLSWLAGGRSDPSIDQGYVFIFFYGLEHRVLRELLGSNAWGHELGLILAELRRLLLLYPRSASFQGYCGSLAQFLECFRTVVTGTRIPLPVGTRIYEMPLALRFGLGQIVQAGEPVPPDWALAWARAARQIDFKTAAQRCQTEFSELFKLRYAERFASGMKVEPDGTTIRVEYRPASSSLRGHEMHLPVSLPDVTSLKQPIVSLGQLVGECTSALDEYSRALGRKSDNGLRDFLIALLPRDLLVSEGSGRVAGLTQWLEEAENEDGILVCPVGDILAKLTVDTTAAPSRKQLELLAVLLEKVGYGIEPDVRFGARSYRSESTVAVFSVPRGAPLKLTERYAEASAFLGFAVAVAQSDEYSSEELAAIRGHLRGLDAHEQKRIEARLLLLGSDPPSLHGMRAAATALTDAQKAAVADALLPLAAADGRITSEEVGMLDKIYSVLGLSSERLHSSIHSLLTDREQPPTGEDYPVTVLDESRTSLSYPIPKPADPRGQGTLVLDLEKIRRKRDESEATFQLLAQVFGTEVQESHDSEDGADVEGAAPAVMREPFAALTRVLLSSETMSSTDWERLCAEHGVLPAGAIEEINSATLDAFGEALIFGVDPLSIDPEVADQLRREYAQQDQG
jgi:tellurite resistance protein